MQQRTGTVYAVRGAGGFVKIGFTTNLESRMSQLQTGCPTPLRLIGHCEGTTARERALHREFAARRQVGEWFALTDAEAATLQARLGGEPRVIRLRKAGKRQMLKTKRRRR